MCGHWPLPWWSSGSYEGWLRRTLLDLKCRRPDAGLVATAVAGAVVGGLAQPLIRALREAELPLSGRGALLVPIPGWKRKANPLPGLIADQLARQLGLRRHELLTRRHPVLGQHRLGQQLRHSNQEGSFRLQSELPARRAPVLLVDDILTTGATLLHAARCLEQAGWPVLGAACLARTPGRGSGGERHDLRSTGRHGDGPG